ncbi:MAG: hypothetical protein HDR23_07015 [Lachnospiraceae bacterium]|nr:hypothetical protein [Lachnospiraceae bacterium]
MKKFDLQVLSSGRSALIRNMIADYLEVNNKFELCGIGFTKLDESPGAKSDSTTYINEVTSSADIIAYETEFPYEFDAIPSQKALYELWKDGRNHHTGEKAQHTYVRVELFNPIGEASDKLAEYTARKFIVSNEVSDFKGDGGQKISASGTLKAVGDPVQGKFDTVSMKFTEGDFKGKFDADDEKPDADTEA